VALFVLRSGKTKGRVRGLDFPFSPGAQHRVWDNTINTLKQNKSIGNRFPPWLPKGAKH
jgi:hypothetical protein